MQAMQERRWLDFWAASLHLEILAQPAFLAVFQLRRLDRLPLHVGRCIGATGAKRGDVVHHPAWACSSRFPGGRARV